jgi:TolB-like protein/DNA-binding winged helix-turn-helix (wHTH) protein/Flp pilus assembly protein TadD
VADFVPNHNVIRFGKFEVDLLAGEVRKGKTKLRLSGQPFQVLAILLERPGELVTREQLQSRLWPDTFVDAEHNLNTMINKIREALGDAADTPRFVETLPRRGYRFIGRIEPGEPEPSLILPASRKPFWVWKPALIGMSSSLHLRKYVMACAVLVLLLALSSYFLRSRIASRPADPSTIRSIAVLPLANLSADPNQQYIVDGMTEELTSEISQLHSLRVISRTSTMQYRDTNKKAPLIAKELHADGLIAGSILQVNDRVRVTVQLIHGPTDAQVWSKSYERDLRDVIAMQRGIASDIAREVQISLGPQEQAHLARAREVMPEVHEAYLRGRFHLQNGSRVSIDRALDYFRQAIQKDVEYAPAYAGVADAYTAMRSIYAAPAEVMPKAKAAALKAVALDETLPEAHVSLGGVLMFYDFDWPGAEREFQRALDIKPSYAEAHDYYAMFLVANRRFQAAVDHILRARHLDPVSGLIAADAAWVFYLKRDYDQLLEQAKAAVELAPNYWLGHLQLGLAYEKKGDFIRALQEFEEARRMDNNSAVLEMLAGTYAAAGRPAEARKITEEMVKLSAKRYVCAYEVATTYAGLRDRESAFLWLRKSLDERADCSPWIAADPKLDSLRSDPRFQDLLRRLGLPQ